MLILNSKIQRIKAFAIAKRTVTLLVGRLYNEGEAGSLICAKGDFNVGLPDRVCFFFLHAAATSVLQPMGYIDDRAEVRWRLALKEPSNSTSRVRTFSTTAFGLEAYSCFQQESRIRFAFSQFVSPRQQCISSFLSKTPDIFSWIRSQLPGVCQLNY